MRARVHNVIYTTWISIVAACFSLLHFVSLCFTLPFHIPMALSPGLGRWQSSGSQVVPAGRPSRVSFTEQDLQLSSTISIYPWFHDISRHWMTRMQDDASAFDVWWILIISDNLISYNIWVFHCSICCMLLALFFYLIWLLLLLMGLRWPIEEPGSDQLAAIAESLKHENTLRPLPEASPANTSIDWQFACGVCATSLDNVSKCE